MLCHYFCHTEKNVTNLYKRCSSKSETLDGISASVSLCFPIQWHSKDSDEFSQHMERGGGKPLPIFIHQYNNGFQ